MSRASASRLNDILAACDAIDCHITRAADDPLSDGLVFDAVRTRDGGVWVSVA